MFSYFKIIILFEIFQLLAIEMIKYITITMLVFLIKLNEDIIIHIQLFFKIFNNIVIYVQFIRNEILFFESVALFLTSSIISSKTFQYICQ